jgi:hypothetical protein
MTSQEKKESRLQVVDSYRVTSRRSGQEKSIMVVEIMATGRPDVEDLPRVLRAEVGTGRATAYTAWEWCESKDGFRWPVLDVLFKQPIVCKFTISFYAENLRPFLEELATIRRMYITPQHIPQEVRSDRWEDWRDGFHLHVQLEQLKDIIRKLEPENPVPPLYGQPPETWLQEFGQQNNGVQASAWAKCAGCGVGHLQHSVVRMFPEKGDSSRVFMFTICAACKVKYERGERQMGPIVKATVERHGRDIRIQDDFVVRLLPPSWSDED